MAAAEWGDAVKISMGGYLAEVQYDHEIKMYRGEFLGPDGGADFYAKDIEGLEREGRASLTVFQQMCAEDGVRPRAQLSVSIQADLLTALVNTAASAGQSLDQWVEHALHSDIAAMSASSSPGEESSPGF